MGMLVIYSLPDFTHPFRMYRLKYIIKNVRADEITKQERIISSLNLVSDFWEI